MARSMGGGTTAAGWAPVARAGRGPLIRLPRRSQAAAAVVVPVGWWVARARQAPHRLPRAPRIKLGRHRLRLAAIAALAVAALLTGAWLWFRDSSFAAVQRVEVSDVSGPDAGAIVAALQHAARGTSTLDVDMAALRGAVSRFPQVRSLRVRAVFPHQLRIEVIEQLPVAVLVGPGGARAAAAADGAVLGSSLVASDLPTITVPKLAAKVVHDSTALEALRVLGAAPPSLIGFVANVSDGPKGIAASLRDGTVVYFGDAWRARAKWLAFARVLVAEGSVAEGSATATYIDVRLPERPAVGGSTAVLSGAELTELGGATAAATAQAASAGTSASLIEALEAALGSAGASSEPATATPSAATPSAAASTEAGASPTATPQAATPGAGANTTSAAAAGATTGAAEAQVPASAAPGG